MLNFVKQTFSILGGTAVEMGKDYMSNATALVSDADEIRQDVMKAGKTAYDNVHSMSKSNVFKKISDWFYQRGEMYDDFDNMDDFDSGMDFDDDENSTTSTLDVNAMETIAKAQTSAMYKIGQKQAEMNIATTAELKTTIDSRTSEIIASLNNINTSVIGISKKLDTLIKNTASVEESIKTKTLSPFNSDGSLSLSNIWNLGKNEVQNGLIGTMFGLGKTMVGTGFGPKDALSMLLQNTIATKELKSLGGKSIEDVAEGINESIGNKVQSILEKVITSETFKFTIGDFTQTQSQQNFANSITNTYNNKPAIFDGATRQSIVTIIPEYLKRIHEDLSGESVYVNDKGLMTNKNPRDEFAKQTLSGVFRNVLNEDTLKDAVSMAHGIDINIDRRTIREVDSMINAQMLNIMKNTGRSYITSQEVLNGVYDDELKTRVVSVLNQVYTKGNGYWDQLFDVVWTKIKTSSSDLNIHIKQWQKKYQAYRKKGIEIAESGTWFGNQAASYVNEATANNYFKSEALKYHDNYNEQRETINEKKGVKGKLERGIEERKRRNEELRKADKQDTAFATSNLNTRTGNFSLLDYTTGIYNILNRGINVRITNDIFDDLNPYKSLSISDALGMRNESSPSKSNGHINLGFGFFSNTKPTIKEDPVIILQNTNSTTGTNYIDNIAQSVSDKAKSLSGKTDNIVGKIDDKVAPYADKARDLANKAGEYTTTGFVDYTEKYYNKTKDKVDKMKTKTAEDAQDKIQAQLVFSMMETSAEDGETNEDKGAILKEVNKINDPVLRSRMRTAVTGMIERSEVKASNRLSIGNIVPLIFTGLKTALNVVLSPIKMIIKAGFNFMKIFGGKVLRRLFLIETNMIKNGFTAVKNALFGGGEYGGVKNVGLLPRLKNKFFGNREEESDTENNEYSLNNNDIKNDNTSSWETSNGENGVDYSFSVDNDGNPTFNDNNDIEYNQMKSTVPKKKRGLFDKLKNSNNSFIQGFIQPFQNLRKDSSKEPKNEAEEATVKIFDILEGSNNTKSVFKNSEETVLGDMNENLSNTLAIFSGDNFATSSEAKNNIFSASYTGKSVFKEILESINGIKDNLENSENDVIETESSDEDDDVIDIDVDENGIGHTVKNNGQMLPTKVTSEMNKAIPRAGNAITTTASTVGAEVAEGAVKTAGTELVEGAAGSLASRAVSGVAAEAGGSVVTNVLGSALSQAGGTSGILSAAAGTVGFDMGMLAGGPIAIAGGIILMIGKAIMGLEGVKKILGIVGECVQALVEPLNEFFETVYDTLEVVIKPLKEILSNIGGVISDLLKPFIEMFTPAFEQVANILDNMKPVIDTLGDTLSTILKGILLPLTTVIENVVVPLLKIIGGSIQTQLGAVQIGFGVVEIILGEILGGIGSIVSFLGELPVLNLIDAIGETGKKLSDTGSNLSDKGHQSIADGESNIVGGIKLYAEGIKGLMPQLNIIEKAIKNNNKKDTKENQATTNFSGGSVLDGTLFGSGDVYNYTYNNTYGSGNSTTNQHNYGGYMNMSERGCGPVVLADALNRRNGTNINPATLAKSMYTNGLYNPQRGTSVSGMISTGNALGMNLRAGGVTAQSLKLASPTNPITLIGNGVGYGTRKGNDHFVNVIGTDKYGNAYVSNPLTGRVDRQSVSVLAMNSKLGLYGSGDEEDDLSMFSLSDKTKSAFKKLTKLTSKLTSFFDIDAEDNDIETLKEKEKKKTLLGTIVETLTPTGKLRLLKEAGHKLWQKINPNGTMEEFEKSDDYTDYMLQAENENHIYGEYMGQWQKAKDENGVELVDANGNPVWVTTNEGLDERMSGIANSIYEDASSLHEATRNMQQGLRTKAYDSGTFASSSGRSRLYLNYDPEITESNISAASPSENPLYEWFSRMAGSSDIRDAYSANGNWYNMRNNPNKDGAGTSGDANHGGIDILFNSGTKDKPVYATTDGKILRIRKGGRPQDPNSNGGCGNDIQWQDADNMVHWYMHLNDINPELVQDAEIKGGQLIGHVGNTGDSRGQSGGYHLHYTITSDTNKSSDMIGEVNPLTYFNFTPGMTSKQGEIPMSPNLASYSYWNSHKNKPGVDPFITAAFKAGLSPAQTAVIMGMGIKEDSGNKIFGDKSITAKTYDKNGQQAYGIMNWKEEPGSHGTTMEEQLRDIYSTYFSPNSSDYRAKVRNNIQSAGAYRTLTGKEYKLRLGDLYGDYINSDLLEGNAHYVASALVPEGYNTASGMGHYIATAADAYNWMIENGYTTVSTPSSQPVASTFATVNSASDALYQNSKNAIAQGMSYGTIIYTKDDGTPVNVRSSPDTNASILTTVGKGVGLYYSEIPGDDKWYSVRYGNIDGFVKKEFIKDSTVVADTTYATQTNTSSVNPQDVVDYLNNTGLKWDNTVSMDYKPLSGSGDIPPLDPSLLYGDNPYVINSYNINSTNKSYRKEIESYYERILNNEYKVKAEKVEQLLQEIIDKIDDKNKPKSPSTTKSDNLFQSNDIPKAVTLLAT